MVAAPLRVSVLVEGRRTDLAVPAGLPVAELLPLLLAGPRGPGPDLVHGPRLATVGGGPLDPEVPLEEQGVPTGAVLLLTGAGAPPVVLDDPAEALGAEVAGAAPWTDVHRAVVRTGAAVVLALLAVVGIARHPDPTAGGLLGVAGAGVLLVLAAWSSRSGRPGAVPAVLLACLLAGAATSAVVAAPWTAWLVTAGPAVGASVVLGGLAGVLALARRRALVLVAVVPGAALGVLGLLSRGPAAPVPLLAALLTVLVVLGGSAPGAALALVGRGGGPLRDPYDPGGADEQEERDGLAPDADRAADLLAGAAGGVGLLLVVAAPVLAAAGRPSAALAAVLALHLVLRARRSRAALLVATELGSGALALAGVAVVAPVGDPAVARVLVPGLLLVVPLLLVLGPAASVRRRRLGDLAETATAVAPLPLLVVVTGLLDRVGG